MSQKVKITILGMCMVLSSAAPWILATRVTGNSNISLIIGCISTATLGVLYVAALKTSVAPYRRILSHVQAMAEGASPIAPIGRRESKPLDLLLESSHRNTMTLRNLWRKDYEIGKDIQLNAEYILKNIKEISETSAGMEKDTETLAAEIGSSKTMIDEIADLMKVASESTETQSAAMDESSAAVEELLSSIHNIAAVAEAKRSSLKDVSMIAEEGRREVEGAITQIRSVRDATSSILGLADIIQDIAEKTNLLSMNAAIEAAHAGEKGKGFAVVAGEIKKLAESSRKNVSSITVSLKTIQQHIKETDIVSSGLHTVMERIIQGVMETTRSMEEIINGMTEMSSGTGQISTALSELVDTAGNVRQSATEIFKRTDALSNSMLNVDTLGRKSLGGIYGMNKRVGSISDSLQLLFDLSDSNSENLVNMKECFDSLEYRKTFLCDYLPPFSYIENGETSGVVLDITKLLCKELEENPDIEFMHWDQAFRLTREVPGIFLLSAIRNKEREHLFKWMGPLFTETMHIFRLSERKDISIGSAGDLKKYTLGCMKNSFDYEYFTSIGIPESHITIVEMHSENIQMLFSGTVDLIPLASMQAVYQLNAMKRDKNQIATAYTIDEIKTDLYIATSVNTPDEQVTRYEEALERVKETKEYKDIFDHYSI